MSDPTPKQLADDATRALEDFVHKSEQADGRFSSGELAAEIRMARRRHERAIAGLLAAASEVEALKAALTKEVTRAITFGDIVAEYTRAMRAAVVSASLDGAESGIAWIGNTLVGPGHFPDISAAKGIGGAQALFDLETAEHEAFRAAHPVDAAVRDAIEKAAPR